MLMIRQGICVSSTWYCKPTEAGLIMNFHALAPKRYRRTVVSGFVYQYWACSTWKNFHQSLQTAKEILEKNQYHPSFYDSTIEETITKILDPVTKEKEPASGGSQEVTDAEPQRKSHRILLQYGGPATDQFVKRLKECDAPTQVLLTPQL